MKNRLISKQLAKNYLCVSLCLAFSWYMLGGLGAYYAERGNFVWGLYEQIPFSVEISKEASPALVFDFQKQLESNPAVLPASVKFIPRHAAWAAMQKEAGMDTTRIDTSLNPLQDILQYRLKGRHFSEYLLQIDEIRKKEFVTGLVFSEVAVRQTQEWEQAFGVSWFGFVVLWGLACAVSVLLLRMGLGQGMRGEDSVLELLLVMGEDMEEAAQVYKIYHRQWAILVGIVLVGAWLLTDVFGGAWLPAYATAIPKTLSVGLYVGLLGSVWAIFWMNPPQITIKNKLS